MLSCVILASGLSKRMGTNKLLLKYKDKYIIQYVIEAVIKSGFFEEIIVVINDKHIGDIIKGYNVKELWNENAIKGQSEAVKLGIKNLSEKSKGVAFFVGDQPLINTVVISSIVEVFIKENNTKIIVPVNEEKRGNPVIFPKDTYDEFLNLSGDIGGREIIKRNMDKVKFIQINNTECFRDIDTKEDYLSLIKGE